jgi:hypothetical protein
MSRVIQVQTNFTSGELDPKLRARIDLQQYYNGLETATNIVVQPQGGFTRRDGSKYIATLPTPTNDAVRMVHFEFSVNDSYMLIFIDEQMYVFKDGVQITNINGSGNDFLAVSRITDSIIPEMCWAQSADTLIIVHKDMIPQKIVRGATDASWTISDLSFDFTPQFAFSISTDVRTSAGTLTPDAAEGNITLTAQHSNFSASDINQYINVTPQGRIRIVDFISNTVVKGISEVPLFDDSVIDAADWEVESGYEDAWSATRGWPRSAVFYEGRLYFGGSDSLPSTLWGSRVGQFFNFDPGESFDDAALEATLDTGRFNAIIDLYAGRNLQIFSTGGEFYIPQTLGDPITPSNLSVQEQTSHGVKPGIRVVNVDGATVFVQRQGKTLAEFIFSDTVNGYIATKISLLSSHLLKDPVEMAVRKATSTNEGDRLLILNDEDGSIACYTLLRSDNIIAPTEWTTDGTYLSIGVDIADTYSVVKRNINGSDAYYVEIFNADVTLDCAKTATVGSSTASVSGLSFLEGETVKIIRDGVVEPDQAVSSGAITFEIAAEESYSIGLNFTPTVTTLPVEPRLSSGNIRGFKKRILEINSEHSESQAVTVNGEQVAFRAFGEDNLDRAVQAFTGVKRSGPLLGYVNEGKITITQTVPLPMNVLALDYKVSIGQ